jgi:hypothetical protein
MWVVYLKGIGVLVREDLVDVRLVSQLMSGQINWWWGKYGQGILQCRRDLSWPRYCIDIEYLYDRVNEYGVAHPELQIGHPRREGTTLSAPPT